MNKFHKILESIGLSSNEANLYLISLKLGPASAIQLGQKIGVTRQMIYILLPSLIEQGLIKETNIGNRRLFQATSPEILLDRTDQILKNVQEIIPLLKSQEATTTSVPLISVYENPISMREWYRAFMEEAKPNEELLIWATNKTWMSVDPDFLQDFLIFKRKNNIRDKIIAPDSAESREEAQKLLTSQPLSEYRFIKDWWQSNAEKWIWRDSVLNLVINENATNLIVIKSQALSEIERFNFNQIWQTLPKETN